MGAERRQQNRQNAWQAEQNQLDRDFQKAMLEQSSALDMQNWLQQFNLQNAQWLSQLDAQSAKELEVWTKQQDYMNKYNSPVEQVKRLSSAGLNPSVLMNGGSSGIGISAPVSAPSLSTSVSGAKGTNAVTGSPSGSPATGLPDEFQSFASVMNAVSQLSSDSLSAVKTFYMLDAEVRKTLSDAQLNEANKVYQDMANNVFRIYGDKKAAADFMVTTNEALALSMRGKYDEANALLAKQQAETEKHRTTKTSHEADYVVRLLSSQIEKNEADALSAREVAKTQGSVRDLNRAEAFAAREQGTYQKFTNDVLRDNPALRSSIASQIFETARNLQLRNEISEEQYQEVAARVEQLQYANEHKEFEYWKNVLLQVVDAGGDALGKALQFKVGKGFVGVQRDRYELERNKANSTEVVDSYEFVPGYSTPRPTKQTRKHYKR